MTQEKIVAALGLGSNLGDTKANIDGAVGRIECCRRNLSFAEII